MNDFNGITIRQSIYTTNKKKKKQRNSLKQSATTKKCFLTKAKKYWYQPVIKPNTILCSVASACRGGVKC